MLLMNSNKVWARCGDCGTELKRSDKQCPKCGSRNRYIYAEDKGTLHEHVKLKQKRKGFRRPVKEVSQGWKRSRDPKLKGSVGEEVEEKMVIDRKKGWIDHVVRDVKTEEITHEEHESLSKHNKKGD